MISQNLQKTVTKVTELTSFIMHKHYCENDGEAIIPLLDNVFSWFGPGEQEYVVGKTEMSKVLQQFNGLVPKCNISDEVYDVLEVTPEIFLCTGQMWIVTDPSTNIYLRVHQRITAVFRYAENTIKCCHLHLSNPYMEMQEEEVGFPTQMGRHSYEYLQECILEQKKQIAEQTLMLEKLSFEDSLTGLFNRNKFNQIIDHSSNEEYTQLGIACFDLNGLKQVNDQLGHTAGDQIICRAAFHIKQHFGGKGYRIGGDEFVIIESEAEEDAFYGAIDSVRENMLKEQISISVGCSWRSSHCSIEEQFDEADRLMYEEKTRFYSAQEHNRRKR